MDKNRILIDMGRICETLLESDLKTKVQLRSTLKLDHMIDGDLLREAWNRTKRVYPLIDAVPGYEHDSEGILTLERARKYGNDHLFLLSPTGGVNDPVYSREPIHPYTETTGRRIISVSYFDSSITISSWHILVDGGGLNMIISTLLYIYLSLYTGEEDKHPMVELTEGRRPEEYYMADLLSHVFKQEYTPVPLYSLPRGCKGFFDEDMYNDENVYSGSLRLDAEDLIRICKETGANPSSLLCALSARAAYNQNPDTREDIVVGLTVALKHTLGIDGYISNAVRNALAYVTYDELNGKPLAETAQRIRKDVDTQRSKDYIVTLCRFFDTYQFVPTVRPRLVTYMGEFNIGRHTSHIVDFNMESTGHYVVYLLQLGKVFLFHIQYGRATERYLEEFRQVFEALGIRTEISRPAHAISPGVDSAILE